MCEPNANDETKTRTPRTPSAPQESSLDDVIMVDNISSITSNDGTNSNACFPFLESEVYQTKYRSNVLLSLALIIVSLSSGLIYGWPALRSRLLLEFEFSNTSTTSFLPGPAFTAFTEQELGLMYTFGSWSTQGGRFFVGLARDRFGTKIVACFSLLCLVIGIFGVGTLSSPNFNPDPSVAGLTACLVLLGIGSGGQLCLQPVAGLFPNHTGMVLASLSGAFQVSGLVFLLLTASPSISLRTACWAFGGGMLLVVGIAAVLLPSGDSFLLEAPDDKNDDDNDSDRDDDDDDEERGETTTKGSPSVPHEQPPSQKSQHNTNGKNSDRGVERVIEESDSGVVVATVDLSNDAKNGDDEMQPENNKSKQPTAWEQIKTPEYLLLVLWFSVGIVPMQYYVGIIGYQLETLGDDTGVYTDLFSYCYAGAALTAPLTGYFADRFGLGVTQGLATAQVALPFFLMATKDRLPLGVQAVALVSYGIGRMGIFGLYFTNCGKRFGYANYGTLSGLGLLVTALVSLLQYPLITWTLDGYSNLVNTLLGVALVLQAPYFVWLHKRERTCDAALC